MKILFITSDYRPVSGWGRLCFEVISRLVKENQLVVLSEKNDLDCINNDFKVLQISSKMNFISIVKNCIIAYKAGKNVDIIHANDIRPYGIYAYVASGFGKKKYIINGVGTYSVAPLRNNLSGKIFRHIYKHAHFVPCISVYTKMRIDDKIKGVNTKVVHMGLSKFKNVESDLNFLNKHNVIAENFPVLVTVGEIKDRKGQLYTSEAVKILKNKYPKIKYLVVGNNGSESYMNEIKKIDESLDGNTIHIINDASGDAELKAIYERSDIFTLNSVNDEFNHFEGFGLVILEANQFGVPAIGSGGCGIEDAISDGENGYLCKQKNVEDIVQKIEMILEKQREDKNYWKDRTKNFANKFSWDKNVETFLEMYKN